MCDFFSQSWVLEESSTTADGGGSDLADIVRASGVSSSAGPWARDPATNAGATDHRSWQLLLQNNDHHHHLLPPLAVDSFSTSTCHDAASLFGADPLLHELVGTSSSGGEMNRLFSRRAALHDRTSSPVLSPPVQIQPPRISAGTMIKRRKGQAKKVVCIPAPAATSQLGRTSSGEVVPSDLWAWRKYGQKPIKGSPHPRGYYRCSSTKGCSARKQVERSRTDPNMLVITYTSEHNHPWPTQRNALAGSTRSSSSSLPPPPPPRANKPNIIGTTAATKVVEPTATTTARVKEEEEEEGILDGDVEKDEAFDRMFYNELPVQSDNNIDFFAELAELDSDEQTRHVFSRQQDEAVSPFVGMYGWGGGSSFG